MKISDHNRLPQKNLLTHILCYRNIFIVTTYLCIFCCLQFECVVTKLPTYPMVWHHGKMIISHLLSNYCHIGYLRSNSSWIYEILTYTSMWTFWPHRKCLGLAVKIFKFLINHVLCEGLLNFTSSFFHKVQKCRIFPF